MCDEVLLFMGKSRDSNATEKDGSGANTLRTLYRTAPSCHLALVDALSSCPRVMH